MQVWRDQNVTSATPSADTDAAGLPLQSATGATTLVATYACEIEQDQRRPAVEDDAGSQTEGVARWIVSILQCDNPNILLGNILRVSGHTFKVVDPAGPATHSVVRLVRCMEVIL